MNVVSLKEIKAVLDIGTAIHSIEEGFVAYSKGEVISPAVGHLVLEKGDCHIKYGYRKGDDFFVIKVASGFYDNPQKGMPVGNGLILIIDAKTGVPLTLLDDQGYLTEIRTAIAGAIVAKHMMPKNTACIGIVGTGAQARYQLHYLSQVTQCREVLVWGRKDQAAHKFSREMKAFGFNINVAQSLKYLCEYSQLIVTTTNACEPLIYADWVKPGTHITAMGADAPGKQELDIDLILKADQLIVDSVSQCVDHGEIHKAFSQRLLKRSSLMELGHIITQPELVRASDSKITIADLTGVAIQDIQIALHIYRRLADCI